MPRPTWTRRRLLRMALYLGLPGATGMTRDELYEHLAEAHA